MTLLETHIERLLAWLRERRSVPTFSGVLVLSARAPDVTWVAEEGGKWRLPRHRLETVRSFAPRFAELLAEGYPWVNLSAYGIFEGSLILGVEWSSTVPRVPCPRTSVNYSGPPLRRDGEPVWKLNIELVR